MKRKNRKGISSLLPKGLPEPEKKTVEFEGKAPSDIIRTGKVELASLIFILAPLYALVPGDPIHPLFAVNIAVTALIGGGCGIALSGPEYIWEEESGKMVVRDSRNRHTPNEETAFAGKAKRRENGDYVHAVRYYRFPFTKSRKMVREALVYTPLSGTWKHQKDYFHNGKHIRETAEYRGRRDHIMKALESIDAMCIEP